jgi:pimeloyl-ACP methyl ester carboxylesterase
MAFEWETLTRGPEDAEHGVLLLPGGGCPAASLGGLMAAPALAGLRLVAATLPGHAGTPPAADCTVEHHALLAAELARQRRCETVMGFSMGATVALEMAVSGQHSGPVVLAGISLSATDEPAFFRGLVRVSPRLGDLPVALLMRLAATMAARSGDVPVEHRGALVAGLRRNDRHHLGRSMAAYATYLGAYADPAGRLCAAGVPAWLVHTEKGDGGLTAEERAGLEQCESVHLVTLPGASTFLPEERPAEVAAVIAEAVRAGHQSR